MLSLPPCVRIFVSTEPTDMRNSFDGLAARAALVAAEGPMSGHLFVFFNRSRSHVKILWWDRTGYLVLAKRLESGRFRFLDRVQPSSTKLELSSGELALILEGIDLSQARRRFPARKMPA